MIRKSLIGLTASAVALSSLVLLVCGEHSPPAKPGRSAKKPMPRGGASKKRKAALSKSKSKSVRSTAGK
jgi:hypothetical protein